MAEIKKEWTHKNVKFTDIRKLNKLYIISTRDFNPLFVNERIFEDRLRSYFLKDAYKVTREEIMGVSWNMYVSKGHYIKVDIDGNVQQFDQNPEKNYVSFLEIDGPLGSFLSILNEDKNK